MLFRVFGPKLTQKSPPGPPPVNSNFGGLPPPYHCASGPRGLDNFKLALGWRPPTSLVTRTSATFYIQVLHQLRFYAGIPGSTENYWTKWTWCNDGRKQMLPWNTISSNLSNSTFFSSGALYCIKRRTSWCVWMVSAGVWMVSGWFLRLSENVSIPNILATNYIRPWFSEIAFSSSSL